MARIAPDRIDQIATQVATANLGVSLFTTVPHIEIIDSIGRDALQFTINLTPGSSTKITGSTAATTVFDMNQKLRESGEERFAIVRFST